MRRALLLFLVTTTSCAESRAPARQPGFAASGPRFGIEVIDEAISFPTRSELMPPFVVGPDDSIVVVASDAPGSAKLSSRVIALDEHLRTRWELHQDERVEGLLALGDVTLIATALTASNDTTLQLVDRTGKVTATSTFQSLLGVPCSEANRYWLAPERGGFVALGACGTPRQYQWVHVTADLRSATKEPGNSWNPIHARDWLAAPMVAELSYRRLGDKHVLVTGLDRPGIHGINASTAAIGDGDLLVGAWTSERQGETAMFSNRAFVTRLGQRPWSTDLVPERTTADPQHVAAVAVARDGNVVAALDYGREGRVNGVRLPAPAQGEPPLGASATRGLAVAELGGDRGELRGLVVTRPRHPWSYGFIAEVGATAHHLVLADAQQIVVFPRHGRSIAPVADDAVIAAPAPRVVPAVAALTPLPERWSELCGPRVLAKANQPCRLEHVALGPDGTVAAGGGYYGANQLASRPLRKQAYETGLLAVYAPGGALRWQKVFGVSWHNEVDDVVVRDDGRIVITGVHGQHFAIDGRTLPERVVRKVSGQDMDFEANSGFLAVFDASGKLELLEDLDVLATGERSTATDHACYGTLAASTTADVTWVLARCPQGVVRIPLRGATPEPPTTLAVAGVRADTAWTLAPTGDVLATAAGLETTKVVRTDGHRFAALPIFASRASGAKTVASRWGTWSATAEAGGHAEEPTRLVVSHTDPTLTHAISWLLAIAPGSTIDGLTIDDQGRAIVALQTSPGLTIGGQAIAALTLDAVSPVRGRAFVRLTADGTRVDRVFIPALTRTECTRPSHGLISSMAARGTTLAVTFGFGIDAHCGVHDEPSTVMVFDTN